MTTPEKMPSEIWIRDDGTKPSGQYWKWDVQADAVKYIPADIHEALKRRVDILKDALEDIRSVSRPEFIGAPQYWMENVIDRAEQAIAAFDKARGG